MVGDEAGELGAGDAQVRRGGVDDETRVSQRIQNDSGELWCGLSRDLREAVASPVLQ